MDTEQSRHNINDDKSGSEMLSEICRLLLKLLIKCIVKLLKLIIKGLRLVFVLLKMMLQACVDFWNDNSTQEKIHMARRWCVDTLKLCVELTLITLHKLWQWSIIALKATVRGTVWVAKATVRGIIHLRPTIVLISKVCLKGLKATWKGMRWLGRTLRLFALKRKRAYLAFRKNKGFKGLLLDIKNHLQHRLNDYMDEGQEDAASDAMSYGEYITDEIGDETKTRSIGKKIYKSMNKLFDDNE